jgi:hypothetical protein
MIIDSTNFEIDCFHSAEIINCKNKSKRPQRYSHLTHALQKVKLTGHVMEFGVYQGLTLKIISDHFSNQIVWGFDSFEGLPETWFKKSEVGARRSQHPPGKFALDREELKVVQNQFAKRKVKLVPGWFNQTVSPWMDHNPGVISFLHVDCDLYSSTLDILTLLNDRIVPGTVIVFDEMYPWNDVESYDLWAQGEFRALGEWLQNHRRSFRTLYRNQHQQCSIEVVV